MSRTYVHFLGYSEAEGGVQEIITDNTFSMGAIDLETGEREFDEIEFDVPLIDILKVKPVSENEAGTLMQSLLGRVVDLSNPLSYPINIQGVEWDAGQLFWAENERIEVVYNFSTYANYTLRRARNGSLLTYHVSDVISTEEDFITVTTKRLSPIGLTVKLYNKEKVLAYGKITEISKKSSGLARVKCSNLYAVSDAPLYFKKFSRLFDNGYTTLKTLQINRANEFFSLFDCPSFPYDYTAKTEPVEGTDWCKIDNVKDFVSQITAINNSFVVFKDGRYSIATLNRAFAFSDITETLLRKNVLAGGSLDFEMSKPVSAVSVSNPAYSEAIEIWASDSNFTRAYGGAKKVSLDTSALVIDGGDVVSYDVIRSIADTKLFMLNNIIEYMTFDVSKNTIFEVGKFYKFIDIFKYPSFYDGITDNVFFCISIDETTIKFARTLVYSTKLVAPSILVSKTGTSEFTLIDTTTLGDFVYSDDTSNISVLENKFNDSKFFEADDLVTVIDVNGTVYERSIVSIAVDGYSLRLSSDIGSVGDVFLITIESIGQGASLATKNEAYFFDNNEGAL